MGQTMNPLTLCKGQTFIPKGTGLSTVDFTRGDAIGFERRSVAVIDAIKQGALMEPGSVREKLYALQASIGSLPDIECPLQHVFAPGVYARTIFLPQGGVLVGKIHRHAHINILSSGTVSVLTEAGGRETLLGPITMVSDPGTKRAVLAITDVVWTTIHLNPSDTRDLAQLESEIIAKTYDDFVKGNQS